MKRMMLLCFLLALMSLQSFAVGDQLFAEGLEQFGTDKIVRAVPPQTETLAEFIEGGVSISAVLKLSPSQMFDLVKLAVSMQVSEASRTLLSIVAAVLLTALLNQITDRSELSSVFSAVSVLAVTAALAVPLIDCIRQVSETVYESANFMLTYVPVYSTVIVAGGQAASGASYAVSVMAAAQLTSQLAARFLVPLCGVYLALCIAGALSGNSGVLALSSSVKKLVVWSLTLAMTLFVGILSLQSFMASAADSATAKTTKFLVGTFVPVVGGAIADALGSAQGCIRLIKATVGSFGIFVAVLTFLPVLARIVILKLIVGFSQAIGETLGTTKAAPVLGSFSNALSVLLAILLSMCLLIVISTAVMLTAGGVQ